MRNKLCEEPREFDGGREKKRLLAESAVHLEEESLLLPHGSRMDGVRCNSMNLFWRIFLVFVNDT